MTTLANFPKPVVTPYTTEKTGKRIFKVSHKEIIKQQQHKQEQKEFCTVQSWNVKQI